MHALGLLQGQLAEIHDRHLAVSTARGDPQLFAIAFFHEILLMAHLKISSK